MTYPEPTQWNGSDDRDLGTGGIPSVERAFWKAFRYFRNRGELSEFFAVYEPLEMFAELVTKAKQQVAAERVVREMAEGLTDETRELLELKGML